MQTFVSVHFHIPFHALEMLLQMSKQNELMKVELDSEKREIKITADLLDFPEYANDWNEEDFNNYWNEVE